MYASVTGAGRQRHLRTTPPVLLSRVRGARWKACQLLITVGCLLAYAGSSPGRTCSSSPYA